MVERLDADVVIDAGIAGAGVAAELAKRFRLVIVEMEERPGYHATAGGRRCSCRTTATR